MDKMRYLKFHMVWGYSGLGSGAKNHFDIPAIRLGLTEKKEVLQLPANLVLLNNALKAVNVMFKNMKAKGLNHERMTELMKSGGRAQSFGQNTSNLAVACRTIINRTKDVAADAAKAEDSLSKWSAKLPQVVVQLLEKIKAEGGSKKKKAPSMSGGGEAKAEAPHKKVKLENSDGNFS